MPTTTPWACYSRTFGSSVVVERPLNHATTHTQRNRPKKMEAASFYHLPYIGTETLSSFAWPSIVVRGAARAVGVASVAHSDLKHGGATCSLTADLATSLTSSPPDWPTHSPVNYKFGLMGSALLKHRGGDWSGMETSWPSLIRPIGLVASSALGGWVWRATFASRRMVLAPVAMQALHFLVTDDIRRITACEPRVDLLTNIDGDIASGELHVRFLGKVKPTLQVSGIVGYDGVGGGDPQ